MESIPWHNVNITGIVGAVMDSLPDLVSKLPIVMQYFLAALLLFALVTQAVKTIEFLWRIPMWILRKIWKGREEWGGHSTPLPAGHGNQHSERREEERAFKGRETQHWCNMRAMSTEDWYQLNLGETRTITRIQLIHGKGASYPKRIKLTTYETDKANPIEEEYDTPNGVNIALSKARKVKWIQFDVLEPNCDNHPHGEANGWRIYDIKLYEKRLGGLWPERWSLIKE